MRKILISIFSACALFGENLQDIYELSLFNDPSFLSAKEALKAGEEIEYQGYSVLMPKITLNSSSGYNMYDIKYKNSASPFFQDGEQNYNASSYSANLVWPILRKDSFDLYRGSKILLKQAKESYRLAEQNMILKVASAYFDYLLANDNLEFLRSQKKSTENLLESAKLNFKLGNATAIETSEAEARNDLIAAKELLAMQDLAVKKDLLEKISGKKLDSISPLADNLDETIFATKSLEELKASITSNPTLKRAKEQSNYAALEYERSKASFFPAVDFVAQRGRNLANGSVQGPGVNQLGSYVGVTLQFNIFNGGYDLSKTREYLANKNKAAYDFEALKQQIENETLQRYLGVSIGLAQMKASKKAMESAKLSLESFKIGQQIGLRSSTDLLNSEQEYFETQKNFASSKYNLIMSYLKLRYLTSELHKSDIIVLLKM